jgi:hypothetical protein
MSKDGEQLVHEGIDYLFGCLLVVSVRCADEQVEVQQIST